MKKKSKKPSPAQELKAVQELEEVWENLKKRTKLKSKKSKKPSSKKKESSPPVSDNSNNGRQDTDWSDTQSRFRGPRGDTW